MGQLYNYLGNELKISSTNPLFRGGLEMIAHRGTFFLGMPENSIPAFRTARELGYKYIECDVLPTSDSKYVIMHDASINRTCKTSAYGSISGTVNVASQTFDKLRNNYVLASDNPKYRQPIPSLQEYLITCRSSDSIAMIELKSSSFTNAQLDEIYSICMNYLGKGKFCFNSANYGKLDYMRTIDADIELFYETNPIINTTNTVNNTSRNNPRNIWYPPFSGTYGTISTSVVKSYHDLGMKVFLWTVPADKVEEYINMGVDGIATNTVPSQVIGGASSLERFDSTNTSSADTNGTMANGKCTLSSGQYFKLPNNNSGTGIKCIRIYAKGNYTVTTNTKTYPTASMTPISNFTKTYNDTALTFHELYMLYNNDSVPLFTITASGSTEIYSVDYYDVPIDI